MQHRIPALLLLSIALGGCLRQRIVVGSGAETRHIKPVYDRWQHRYLLGWMGEPEVDVKSVCPSGNAVVRHRMTFLNAIFLIPPLIVAYNPTTVQIWCAENQEPDNPGFLDGVGGGGGRVGVGVGGGGVGGGG